MVHVVEIEPAADDTDSQEQGPRFRVGLRRLGETALPAPPAVSRLAGTMRFRLAQWRPSNSMRTFVGVMMAVIVVVVPVAMLTGFWYAGQSKAKWHSQSSDELAKRVMPDDWPLRVGSGAGSPAPEPEKSSGSPGSDLADAVRRLPGATALMLPEVVRQLQLTADQQAKTRELIDATFQAMRELDRSLAGQPERRRQTSELRTQLFDHARNEALGLLTKEQRAKWDKLVGDHAPPPP